MKIVNIVLKVVFCLLIASPILGSLGIFPEPTRDMYYSDQAFGFIQSLYTSGYVMYGMSIVFALAIYFMITKRVALSALLVLPVALNIVAFHAFLDGGIFTGGAIMGNILLILTIYFLWDKRGILKTLFAKSA